MECNGSNNEIAKENAAQYMFSLMENEGTETIKKYNLRQRFSRCSSWFSSVKKWNNEIIILTVLSSKFLKDVYPVSSLVG